MATEAEFSPYDNYLIIAEWLKSSVETGLFIPPEVEMAFERWCGATVQGFLNVVSPGFLKQKTDGVLHEPPEVFVLEDLVAEDYEKGKVQTDVEYGICKTPFGVCLMAVDQHDRICWISFFEQGDDEIAITELKSFWFHSSVKFNQLRIEPMFCSVFSSNALQYNHSVRLLAMGSPFQLRVWKQLFAIRAGSVTSYQALAKSLGLPGGSQAVGSALAKNHLALVVPCHRVIRKDGSMHQFRWGSVRKKMMIGFEFFHGK
jgi:AraC family transcriptional regulator of adaptative response/methylated-DNA-[protein]-cysteine methyltransferase